MRSTERRPRLWMVFAGLSALVFSGVLVGLGVVRVYDDQLIRQTEVELISQGVVVAQAYLSALPTSPGEASEAALPAGDGAPLPGALEPILPSLRAGDPVLGPPDDPPLATAPAEPSARLAGEALTPLLRETARHTLAGLRVVDARGVVVATSRAGLGSTLLPRPEVVSALRGVPASVLRRRLSDPGDTPLASVSRDAGLRVTVALPATRNGRVLGAVVLSRTPMTPAKALYADRWNLSKTVAVLLAAMAVLSLGAAAFMVRPVRALVAQTRDFTRQPAGRLKPLSRPVLAEIAELSEAFVAMASALSERNAYIRSFATSVSHEFKTPLASIKGAVELLRDSGEQMPLAQRERFLANIDADASRLTLLVQRLLELARADAMVPLAGRCNLFAVASAAARQAVSGGAVVDLHCPAEAGDVALPEEVLDPVLTQLLANARQHGGPSTRVTLAVTREDRTARVTVRDDGPGISAANRARVFDAFFTTSRDAGGTGLGLTICRALLAPFQARLELVPSERGATFLLSLPVAPGKEPGAQRK